jgi:NADH dehydrogenase FAD-containing subunit
MPRPMSEERESGTTAFQEEVGVLIIGAGPTGLTLAAQLHALGGVDRYLARWLPGAGSSVTARITAR